MDEPTPYLQSGQSLGNWEWLTAANFAFYTVVQSDGNLCTYEGSESSPNHGDLLWQSGTAPGDGNYTLNMQRNAQAVLKDGNGVTLWTPGFGPQPDGDYFLAMRDDASLAIYSGQPPYAGPPTGDPLWTNGVSQPVKEITISDIDYDLASGDIVSTSPTELYRETVTNTSDQPQSSTITAEATTTWTSEWKDTIGAQVTAKTEFKTDIPFLADGKIETSVDISNTYEFGETTSNEKKWQLDIPVEVPANSATEVIALATESKVKVPYTMELEVTLQSGKTYTVARPGIFTGVSSRDLDVKFNKIPLPGPS